MYDYIVVGSGIAGLFTALLAAEHGRVLIVSKGALAESNTRYAQGGIAAATDPDDSPQSHFDDTITAGAGLCEPHAVDILTRLAPDRIADLIRLGVEFDRDGDTLARGREGAHSRNRILHAGGDATGARVEAALCHVARAGRIDILERTFVTEILLEPSNNQSSRAAGVRTLGPDGRVVDYEGRHVVLASGGSGALFRYTTNPPIATGDGLAAAFRAGAVAADLEFYQFHPTALALPGVQPFLISEAVRGEGGVLRDGSGRAFMKDYDPRGDLASRDVVSRAIVGELAQSGSDSVYLDVTHLPNALIEHRFPTIRQFCADHGLDITREPIPVAPAAHYYMGGVLTSSWGETSLPGLFACGEVAASGVHGANRLASNSLLEGIVFGWRIVQRTLGADEPDPASALLPPLTVEPNPPVAASAGRPTLENLQRLMWDQVGLVRNRDGLEAARAQLAGWIGTTSQPANRSEHELANLVLIGWLMTEAAIRREESRGAHFRSDFPESDPAWRRRIVLRSEAVGGQLKVRALAAIGSR